MGDDVRKKISGLETKLKLDPKIDKVLKKEMSLLDKALKEMSGDYVGNVKKVLASLSKKKKSAADKEQKDAVVKLEQTIKSDFQKRFANKDASTKPS